MKALRRVYGAPPLHLVAHLAALALAAYAVVQVLGGGGAAKVVAWLVGAVVLHDFVLLPLYSGLDGAARRATPRRATNFVRVPAGLAGLLLLVHFPSILGTGERTYTTLSGLAPEGYLGRWLLLTGLLFGGSAVLFVLRARRRRTPQVRRLRRS